MHAHECTRIRKNRKKERKLLSRSGLTKDKVQEHVNETRASVKKKQVCMDFTFLKVKV